MDVENLDEVIKNMLLEDEKRVKNLFEIYDPIKGIGSKIERFKFNITSDEVVFLPLWMKDDDLFKVFLRYNSLQDYSEKNMPQPENENDIEEYKNKLFKVNLLIFNEIREKYDFEFYCATKLKIQDKLSKEEVCFILNKPQRKYYAEIHNNQISKYLPIRIKLVKTRQWGGSTVTEALEFWIQDKWKPKRWHLTIVGDIETQAKNVFSYYRRFSKNYEGKNFSIKQFERTKNYTIKENEVIVSIGSMQKPDSIRSADNCMLHATELGSWKGTEMTKPEDLLQTLVSSIATVPFSLIALESTAKGIGNFWYKMWITSNAYYPIFVGWHEAEKNYMEVDNKEEFIKSLNKYEEYLWTQGATIGGIKWYRQELSEMNGDLWRMQSENPTNAREAFQSTGNKAFSPLCIQKRREQFTCSPIAIGKLFSNSTKGEEACENLRFEELSNGEFFVWEYPDKKNNINHRYLVIVDIGGRTKRADWSIITVIDNYNIIKGGFRKVVFRARYHIDHDILAWDAVRVATWYHDALLVLENNSLRKNKEENENYFTTVLNEIDLYYDNLYTYMDISKVKEGIPIKWGWHTNRSTKPLVVSKINTSLENDGEALEDPDSRYYDELEGYEIDNSGSYNAVEGMHDDIIMTDGIGLAVAEKMPLPYEIIDRGKSIAVAKVGLNLNKER
jgi:hypothetical protein